MTAVLPSDAKVLASAVFVTGELDSRPQRRRNYRREKEALQELAAELESDPAAVLPRFVELAMDLTGAASAGLSLFEPIDNEAGVFRWRHLRGVLKPFEGATTPRNDSPCGVTLDANSPVLARHPERIYDWIAAEDLIIPEVLLVPLNLANHEPLGTLWIVADKQEQFRKQDAEIATELARFVATGLRLIRSEDQLRESLRRQELVAREMGHRVKNLFAVTDSIVRLTAPQARSAGELAETVSRRLSALSTAHALTRERDLEAGEHVDLKELVEAVIEPFRVGLGRCSVDGPKIACGAKAAATLALVIHELATNATKYGALSLAGGKVAIGWATAGGDLELTWRESGGPEIAETPALGGFGSTLVKRMITRQLSGELHEQWLARGLQLRLSIPLTSIED